MSISSISSAPLAAPLTPGSAVGTQNALLHTTIGERTIKDQIDLSKEAVALLVGGAPPVRQG
jgi:hypothetical protein